MSNTIQPSDSLHGGDGQLDYSNKFVTKITNTINPDNHSSQEINKRRRSKMNNYNSTHEESSVGN